VLVAIGPQGLGGDQRATLEPEIGVGQFLDLEKDGALFGFDPRHLAAAADRLQPVGRASLVGEELPGALVEIAEPGGELRLFALECIEIGSVYFHKGRLDRRHGQSGLFKRTGHIGEGFHLEELG